MTIQSTATFPRGYHAHVYAERLPTSGHGDTEPAHDPGLVVLHARAEAELAHARVGRLHDEAVGPHPVSMFQIAFGPAEIAEILPWLLSNRGDRSVLIHPVHGDALREHTEDAIWIGRPLPLDLGAFREKGIS